MARRFDAPGRGALILDAIGRAGAAKDADRHRPSSPQRFAEIALLRSAYSCARDNVAVPEDVDFLLGDSRWARWRAMRSRRCRIVGGSLLPLGGEPDRADRDGTTYARRAAHVQFHRRDRQGARGRCCARGFRRRGVDYGSERAPGDPARHGRCARPPLRSMPRIVAPRTAVAGSHRSRRDARRRSGGGARDRPRAAG